MDVHDFSFDEYLRVQREQVLSARSMTAFLELAHEPKLVEAAADGLVRALRQLDALPRSDGFWRGTNQLPTVLKLQLLYQDRFDELKDDLDLAWSQVAFAGSRGSGHLPECLLWRLLPREGLPIEWLLEASWLEFATWGPEMTMMHMARQIGRDTELAAQLEGHVRSPNLDVRLWAEFELGR